MGFIFETQIVTIMNTVRVRTIGEADTIQLKDIMAAEIHPAIKAYFKAEVEKLLQQERGKESRSKRFSYGLPEVASLQRQIDLLLVSHHQFDQKEFESLLDEAVHFEFNYLCRPQWTLQEFMFENRRTVSIGEAIRKFRYCVEYTYFPELFKRYVVDRGLAEMSYEEFKSLIARIDAEIVSRHSSHELARLLRPMVEFIEIGIPQTPRSGTGPVLPINAAIVFFEDKRNEKVQKQLEAERDENGRVDISLTELEAAIALARDEQPPVVTQPKSEPKKKEAVRPSIVPADIAPKVDGAVVPPEKQVPAAVNMPDGLDLQDVYSLFEVKDQKVFVRKLFKKDEVEFRNALDRLNPIKTWKEASFALDQIFTEQDVDPFSKEAILLTEKLFGRYEGQMHDKQ